MLAAHLARILHQDPSLLRVFGVEEVTGTIDWDQVAHTIWRGTVPGERALALCLCALRGAEVPNGFGYWFERLDTHGRRTIITLLDTYPGPTTGTEVTEQVARPLFEV